MNLFLLITVILLLVAVILQGMAIESLRKSVTRMITASDLQLKMSDELRESFAKALVGTMNLLPAIQEVSGNNLKVIEECKNLIQLLKEQEEKK